MDLNELLYYVCIIFFPTMLFCAINYIAQQAGVDFHIPHTYQTYISGWALMICNGTRV